MGDLTSHKHELMAQALAKGLSADKACAEAGYKPHRGNAARMSANESIKARVAELQEKQVKKAHEYAAVNFCEQMHKLKCIVDLANEEKDITNALKGQMFIIEMDGFKDMPTLKHEMLGDRGLQSAPPTAPVGPGTPQEPRNILQFGRVHRKLEELVGPRVIDHDPKK